jgi:hypothetical protein
MDSWRRLGLQGRVAPGVLGIAVLTLLVVGCGPSQQAATPTPTPSPTTAPPSPTAPAPKGLSFTHDIQPIFSAHCAVCHIAQHLGGLSLATYQGLVQGGTLVPGPVFKAGDHTHSLLWKMIRPTGPWPGGNRMPLGGPYLSAAQIHAIAAWIDQGARDN